MPALVELFNALMRWMHIASVALVVGGFFYGRMVPSEPAGCAQGAASRFRGWFFAASAALVMSGLYQFLTAPGHTRRYEMLLGVKLLLVAHVIAVGFLVFAANPGPERQSRRGRLMTGAAISGFVIILLSAYLRRTF
jgi:hypothetical protein